MGKAFEKQIKTIEGQGEKQVQALNTFKSDNEKLTFDDLIPKNALKNDEAIEELNKIREIEKTVDREKLIYRASEYTYDFRNFQTIKTFGRDIYEGNITLDEANIEQDNLLRDIRNFNSRTRPQNNMKIQEKNIVLKNLFNFFEGREKLPNNFASKIFLIKSKGSGLLNTNQSKLKILTYNQMLQRLPIALAPVKAANNSENLLNETREIAYFLYQ